MAATLEFQLVGFILSFGESHSQTQCLDRYLSSSSFGFLFCHGHGGVAMIPLFSALGDCSSAACCSYACIFADPDASYVGRLRTTALRAVTVQVSRVLGEKLLTRLSNVMDHAFQIVYLVLCLGSWYVVFVFGFPLMEAYLPSYHRRAAVVLFFLCMGSWHYACHVGPGNVTARTIPLYDH